MERNKAMVVVALIAAAMFIAWMGYPWTKSQCYRWAAERSGERGINMAMSHCYATYGAPNE